MQTVSTRRRLWQGLVHVKRAQISYPTALRNAVGVALPVAVGALLGQGLVGVPVSIGALYAAFSDRPGPTVYGRPGCSSRE